MSNERIDLTKELEWLHRLVKIKQVPDLGKHDIIVDSGWIEGLIAELKRSYELIDELENRSHEDERYPEPDELTPSNTSRAGADWPSGPRM